MIADKHLSADPGLLPNIQQAITRIYRALLSGENIVIYGDFDVDGITATALLVQGLTNLGGKVTPYIPHRLTEGYGLKINVLEKLHQQGISLVITVDCGITAIPQVKRANEIGLDIIITDHHTPLPETPPAVAVVNPKLSDSRYPYTELTAAGVAFKLLQVLLRGVGQQKQAENFMDLVALGTIADMAPMLGENRYLVKQGLKMINSTPRLGIKEMVTQTGLNPGDINTENISWVVAPRLNAAGRLAHAMTSYNLLMTDSPEEASQLSRVLEEKNTERQRLTTKVLTKAKEQILARGIFPLLVTSDKDYPIGIAGLIAGRICEEFYRPTIVVRHGEQTSSGSCRSIPEFNIILALNQCSELLSHFGGHSQAAGFTLPTQNLTALTQRLSQMATTELAETDLRPQLDIDVETTLPKLGGDTFQTICQLAPFGSGNPIPTFISRQVEVINCRTMGSNSEHLRVKLRQGNSVWAGVGFRLGNYLTEISSPLDIVYNLEVDHWQGLERLRLNILDFSTSKSQKPAS